MEGRDGGQPVEPVTGEQRRPSRADSLRLTRMPQIPRTTPIPGQGGGPAGPSAPAPPVSPTEAVRPERPGAPLDYSGERLDRPAAPLDRPAGRLEGGAGRRRLWIAAGVVLLLGVPIVLFSANRLRDRAPASAATPDPAGSIPESLPAGSVGSGPAGSGETGPSLSGAPSVVPEPSASSASSSPSASAAAASAAPKPSVTGRANPSGANLALQGTATASASEGDPWLPANAIDGDESSRWSSGFSDPQWIRVDLGRNWQISEVVLVWEHAYGTAYRVETSTDAKTWNRVYTTSTGTGGTVRISEKTVARYVRMYGTKRVSTYGYSLLELEIR